MQERYCTCGHVVLVRFLGKGLIWIPSFWTGGCYSGEKIHVCPVCGQALSIDELH